MNVATKFMDFATFFTTNLYVITLSAMLVRASLYMIISQCRRRDLVVVGVARYPEVLLKYPHALVPQLKQGVLGWRREVAVLEPYRVPLRDPTWNSEFHEASLDDM
jgi:hypothetical protein